jgi:hypothetical protein
MDCEDDLFSVRDAEWLNVTQSISDLNSEIREDSFSSHSTVISHRKRSALKAKFSIEEVLTIPSA